MRNDALSIAALAAASLLHAGNAAAQNGVPALLPVQGVLTDATGVRLEDPVNVTFSLYDGSSGGVAFHEETQALDPENGLFTAYLGTTLPLELANFSMTEVYLGIRVGTDEEMSPRLRLGTSAYAAMAQAARVCGDATTVAGMVPSDFAAAAHTHSFAELTDVPSGLDDGDDVLARAQVETYARDVCLDTAAEVEAVLVGWDDDASDDLTTATTFGGDVTGTAANLTLAAGAVDAAAIAPGSIGPVQMDVPVGASHGSLNNAGYGILNPNYVFVVTPFTPPSDATCVVTVFGSVHNVDSGDYGNIQVRVARREGPSGLRTSFGHATAGTASVVAPGATSAGNTWSFGVQAGQEYYFGCQITLTAAPLGGDNLHCSASWICT